MSCITTSRCKWNVQWLSHFYCAFCVEILSVHPLMYMYCRAILLWDASFFYMLIESNIKSHSISWRLHANTTKIWNHQTTTKSFTVSKSATLQVVVLPIGNFTVLKDRSLIQDLNCGSPLGVSLMYLSAHPFLKLHGYMFTLYNWYLLPVGSKKTWTGWTGPFGVSHA